MMNLNQNRCDAFWSRVNTDRPLLSAWIGSFAIAEMYPNAMATFPQGQIHPADLDFSILAKDYDRLYEDHARAGSDVPWAAFPIMTLPWVEAVLGCPIYHRDGNIWAGHILEYYEQLDEFTQIESSPWFAKLLEFTHWLVHRFEQRTPISTSLMRGPLDLLSALRGPERMVLDLFDYPEQVSAALEKLTNVWIKVARAQQAVIPPFEGGFAFGQINLWSRLRGGWFQDDALSLWSPKYHRRHLLPQEIRLAGCLPLTGIHLHPSGLYAVNDLVAISDLDVIEVNYDVGGPPLADLIPSLKTAIQNKRLVIWGDFLQDELRLLYHSLPVQGLALQVIAPSPEAFQQKSAEIQQIWRGEG
jgi:hypothetical protein